MALLGLLFRLPASCQTENAIVGDFNGDKIPDIAFNVTGSGGGVAVCLGNGNGTFKDAVISDAGVQHGTLVIGDFNHDGKLDLAASDSRGHQHSCWAMAMARSRMGSPRR